MRWLHSRVIRKTFVSYIAVLYLFFLCFALFSFQEIKKRTQEDIETECVRSAKAMAFTIDQNFSRIQSSTLKLSQLPWIWSFSVTDLTFSNQFLPSDRRGIVSDLQVLAENDNLIQNLTVFFPQKNVAVSSKGWFSTDRYLDMVRSNLPQLWQALEQRRNFDVVYLDREAMAKSPVIWMLNTLDRSAPPRIQLAFSFDKNILANWVSAISFSRFRSFALYDAEGNALARISGSGRSGGFSGGRTIEIPADSFGWKYEITYDPTLMELPVERYFKWIWLFAAALLLGPLAAWFLTYLSYKPVHSLMEKIGQGSTESAHPNEYRILEDTFIRLTEDNSGMKQRVDEYQEFVQHDLSMRLLKGCFDRSQTSRELAYYGIDYTEENSFCVLLVEVADLGVAEDSKSGMDSRMMTTLLVRQMLEECPYQNRMIQVLDEDAVVILSDEKAPLEEASLDSYLKQLKASAAFTLDIWRGEIEPKIIGISKSYHEAKERRFASEAPASAPSRKQAAGSGFYYPTDWEIQLINGVKAGNQELILRILRELKTENQNRHLDPPTRDALFNSLEDTVIRLASELNDPEIGPMSRPTEGGRWEDRWSWVEESLSRLCQRTRLRKDKDQDIGRQILSYVEENFESSNLSLKEISQNLGIALSTASKAFKNVTQMNFYDYTCRLRMERVKRLMAEGESSVRVLCGQVGYENEYSLRRTFQRYEGISITEYREKIRKSKEMEKESK